MDIYILRIGSVVQPEDYKEQFPEFLKNPEKRRYSAWSYIDARDLGQMCRLGVEKDGLGYQASWIQLISDTSQSLNCCYTPSFACFHFLLFATRTKGLQRHR
jgi:hypothetical protein